MKPQSQHFGHCHFDSLQPQVSSWLKTERHCRLTWQKIVSHKEAFDLQEELLTWELYKRWRLWIQWKIKSIQKVLRGTVVYSHHHPKIRGGQRQNYIYVGFFPSSASTTAMMCQKFLCTCETSHHARIMTSRHCVGFETSSCLFSHCFVGALTKLNRKRPSPSLTAGRPYH